MDIVLKKLELRSALTPEETTALRSTFAVKRAFEAGEDLLIQGEKPAFVGALLSGMLCRYKPLPNGQRQIVSFPLPGDIFDLHSFTLEMMDHTVGALTRSIVATAPNAAVEDMAEAHPRLAMLLWRDAVVEGSVFREWIVNCGRRNAYARVAHLFCELYLRSTAIGLTSNGTISLPLTQTQLSDATGLSAVHVNRVLQRLRSEKLIANRGRQFVIIDWEGLVKAGGFNADYLHTTAGVGDRRGFALGRADGSKGASGRVGRLGRPVK